MLKLLPSHELVLHKTCSAKVVPQVSPSSVMAVRVLFIVPLPHCLLQPDHESHSPQAVQWETSSSSGGGGSSGSTSVGGSSGSVSSVVSVPPFCCCSSKILALLAIMICSNSSYLLQCLFSSDSPSQGSPSYLASVTWLLVRVFTPSPHVTEQSVHWVHIPHSQSTAGKSKKKNQLDRQYIKLMLTTTTHIG